MSYKLMNNLQIQDKKGKDYIYYDVSISNIYVEGKAQPILASYNESTPQLLHKQNDYQLQVYFWSLKGDLPIFIMPILEGTNPNINDTIFGICLTAGGIDFPQRMEYVSASFNPVLPKPPSENNGLQDNKTSNYYYVYTFENLIQMINTTFQNSYNAMNTAFPGLHNSAPWFEYNESSGKFILYAEYSYSQPGAAEVFVNAPFLQTITDSIEIIFYGYNNVNFKDAKYPMFVKPHNQNGWAEPPNLLTNPPAFLKFAQEYNTMYTLSNIRTIIFTTNSIETRPEYLPSNENGNVLEKIRNTFNPDSKNILSYYDIIYDTNSQSGANWRQYLYFAPSIEKWVDLTSSSSLNRINIEIYFQTVDGSIHPLFLPLNNSADIKLSFRKN